MFVHGEPYQIFMGVNMEYRANLVSLFVCFPHVCLLVKMESTTVTIKVYSVANKSEYIRKGYTLRKSLKGLKYKKQKTYKLTNSEVENQWFNEH